MTAAVIYVGIAMGVAAATGRFRVSWLWPYTLGKLIGEAWADRR